MWKSHVIDLTYIPHYCHHSHSLNGLIIWASQLLETEAGWVIIIYLSGICEHLVKWVISVGNWHEKQLTILVAYLPHNFMLLVFKSSSFQAIDQQASLFNHLHLVHVTHWSLSPGRSHCFAYGEDFPSTPLFTNPPQWGYDMAAVHFFLTRVYISCILVWELDP